MNPHPINSRTLKGGNALNSDSGGSPRTGQLALANEETALSYSNDSQSTEQLALANGDAASLQNTTGQENTSSDGGATLDQQGAGTDGIAMNTRRTGECGVCRQPRGEDRLCINDNPEDYCLCHHTRRKQKNDHG